LAFASTQAHALLVTTTPGDLIFEFLDGKGGTSTQEFGLGTPSTTSTIAERDVIFLVELVSETVASVSPSSIVNFGFFPAGSVLDFYNVSSFGGTFFAFSSSLGGSPTARDLVVFTDTNNSLGFGGSAVETVGVDDWILHLDDAASISFDDDDNELIISVRVVPSAFPVCIDQDEDGFGSPGVESCPAGSVADCDDLDASVFPGAEELCDGKDNDCDGQLGVEEVDNDLDGFLICEGDCNDDDPSLNPDAVEINFNFVDENCDGDLGECNPCFAWSNHGEYVRCVAAGVSDCSLSDLTAEEANGLVSSAATSDIGKKGFVPVQCQQ